MENYPIKSVAFGGFDKQDVVRYIEQAAETAAAAQTALQAENDALRTKTEALQSELAAVRSQLAELTARHEALQAEYTRETAARQALEPLKPLEDENSRLKAEAEALRPDAQAYAQFRERIGAIECEARKRADDLERATVLQLQQTLDLFRQQYQTLMSTFETTASHVNSELRKVEVNLSQLPRTMDRPDAELNELAQRLEQIKQEKSK